MDTEQQRSAYLRVLLVARHLHNASVSPSTEESDESAAAWVKEGPSPNDVWQWQRYLLLHRNDEADAATSHTWTHSLCCWLCAALVRRRSSAASEGAKGSDCQQLWGLYVDSVLPKAKLHLTAAEYAAMAGALSNTPSHPPTPTVRRYNSPATAPTLACVLARCHAALGKDMLDITWDLLHPQKMPADVINCISGEPVSPLLGDEAKVIHAACLEPLVDLLLAGGHGADTKSSELCDEEKRSVQRFLVRAAYDVLTKMDSGMVERAYCGIPFLVDFAACSTLVETPSGEGLPMLNESLFRAVAEVARRQMGGALKGYSQSATKSKTLVSIPSGPSITLLSPNAFAVLCEVVEPSLNVLRRYTGPLAGLTDTALGEKMQEKLRDAMKNAAETSWSSARQHTAKPSAKFLTQAATDLSCVLDYISNN